MRGYDWQTLSGALESPLSLQLVPSKGLEPPHPCGYMDLNHARLPIPPRWQSVSGRMRAADQERTTGLFYEGQRVKGEIQSRPGLF